MPWHRLVAIALAVAYACGVDGPVQRARRLQDAKQYEQSIAPLRERLAIAPDPEAFFLLGRALIETQHASEAVWPLHRATGSDAYAIEAGTLLAQVFMRTKNFEEAIAAADRVLAKDPQHRGARRVRAGAALGLGKADEACELTSALIATEPDDRESLVLHASALIAAKRLEDAEAVFRRLKEMPADDAGNAPRLCLALAGFLIEQRQDRERAAIEVQGCRERHPDNPVVLEFASRLADQDGRSDEATAWWRAAAERRPDVLALSATLAQRLERAGRAAEATAVLRTAAERSDAPEAWQLLGELHRRQGDAKAAETALARATPKAGPAPSILTFTRADLLVEAGQFEQAEALAASLDDPGLRELMRARILAAQGEYQRAMVAFDAGIPSWPNNAGARYLAGFTAEQAGDFERALQEYRAAVRAGRRETDAALMAARLYFALGRYSYAIEFARMHAGSRRPSASDGLVLAIRAATKLEEYDAARGLLDRLERQQGQEVTVVVERAALARAATGPTEAASVITGSGLDLRDPANEAALRGLVDHLVAADQSIAALAAIDAALERHPEASAFHDLHGRVLAHLGRDDDAAAAFERALAIAPDHGAARRGLATLRARRGDWQGAVRLFDEAVAADAGDFESRYAAVQQLIAAGHAADARVRLEEIVRGAPTHARACNDLAWLLAESGEQIDRAFVLATRAVALEPSGDTLDTLGWVQLKRGDAAAAVATLEQALAKAPGSPTIQAHLSVARAATRS